MHNFTKDELKFFIDGLAACNDDVTMREVFNQLVTECPMAFVNIMSKDFSLVDWPHTPTINSVKRDWRQLTCNEFEQVHGAWHESFNRNKVAAIKCLRGFRRMGLLEAKQIVEAWFCNG